MIEGATMTEQDNLRDRIADIIECVGDDWDAQLIKACTETDGTPHPHTDHVLTGAKWQRDQLRTDEAHEIAARAIARMEPDEEWADETEHDAEYRHDCFETAWEVISALLGERN